MSNPPIVPRTVVLTLGCPVVNIVVQPRGGGRTIPIPVGAGSTRNWSSVEWHRLNSDQSGTQIRIEGRAQCCDWASRVNAWEHEIAVFNDGSRVWSGPVTEVVWVGDELRIDCKDRSEWWRRRKIHFDHEYGATVDLSTIFGELVTDGMSVDTSPNISLVTTPSGIVVGDPEGRKYVAAQRKSVNDAINELARSGLEWTCVDFDVYVRGPQAPSASVPKLRYLHFESEPEGVLDGGLFGTRFEVSGAGRGEAGDTIVGSHAIDATLEAQYGVHEVLVSEDQIRDQDTANDAAATRFNQLGKNGPPFYLTGGILSPNAPVTVNSLIPGTIYRVEAEDPCKPVPQYVRLDAVTGSVGPEHNYIKIDLTPIVDES